MAEDILEILADPPTFFKPLPVGEDGKQVERRSYKKLTLEELRDTVNHLYDVNRLLAEEVTRQRTAIVAGNDKIRRLWRFLVLACMGILAAWSPLWLPLLMKLAGLK